jgi:hypothetical protein
MLSRNFLQVRALHFPSYSCCREICPSLERKRARCDLSALLMLSRNKEKQRRYAKRFFLSTLLMLSRNAGKVAVNLPILPANFTLLAFHPTRIVAKHLAMSAATLLHYTFSTLPMSSRNTLRGRLRPPSILYLLLAAWWFERVGNVHHFEH